MLLPRLFGIALLSLAMTAGAGESSGSSATSDAETQAAAKAAEYEQKLTTGLARLKPFAGRWSIVSLQQNAQHEWHETERSRRDFVWTLGERLLETEGHMQGADFRFSLSYDALKSVYRVALIDSGSGVMDIYQGNFDATDTLVVTNPDFYQWRIKAGEHGWNLDFHYSKDQGKTWSIYARHELTALPN